MIVSGRAYVGVMLNNTEVKTLFWLKNNEKFGVNEIIANFAPAMPM